jgi:quercetin dioxygenase-like cupin family protein
VSVLVPGNDDGEPCVLLGTVPPGSVVPLHSHADPETFVMLAGMLEGLEHGDDGHAWVPVRAGEVFHVPPHARHAWRNTAGEPAVSIVVTTATMGLFFAEVGERPERFLEIAERHGHWNGSWEDNAAVGLALDR